MRTKEKAGKVKAFWDNRARLGFAAGTQDTIVKQLEIESIASFLRDGMRVLEIGCGNGLTAIEMAKRHDIDVLAIDYSEKMVEAANSLMQEETLKGHVEFRVADVCALPKGIGMVDLAYSERCLINLHDWTEQKQAIESIVAHIDAKGAFVMCENSQEGLDSINEMRAKLKLPIIEPPWHNRYFRDWELEKDDIVGAELVEVKYFTSTYYLLSRVVNAYLASLEGKEPDYLSPVNKIALQLPSVGKLGQTRMWIWKKREVGTP